MNVETKIISREISVILWKAGATLSTAESCTAGQIASAITTVPGSSMYYKGGVVAYSNEAKVCMLSVSQSLLDEKGPVSEEVAREMVSGALQAFDTNFAVAVTGYAGPGSGEELPVGTIYVAVGCNDEIVVEKLDGDEGRDINLQRATQTALQMLLDLLKKRFPAEEA